MFCFCKTARDRRIGSKRMTDCQRQSRALREGEGVWEKGNFPFPPLLFKCEVISMSIKAISQQQFEFQYRRNCLELEAGCKKVAICAGFALSFPVSFFCRESCPANVSEDHLYTWGFPFADRSCFSAYFGNICFGSCCQETGYYLSQAKREELRKIEERLELPPTQRMSLEDQLEKALGGNGF
jgi:hypothetical protein